MEINYDIDYLVTDYDEGTSEIVCGYDLEEKVAFERECGVRVCVTEIRYGKTIIDDTK
tara:strand:+ start:288 stop:461 length:174 start_codon:yes stop_codon:yes gene_type:complete